MNFRSLASDTIDHKIHLASDTIDHKIHFSKIDHVQYNEHSH